MTIGLCIAENYYRLGVFRVEYFSDMRFLEKRRAELDRMVTSWILGDPIPPRRRPLHTDFK